MIPNETPAKLALRRGGAILVVVGLVASIGVYFGHAWFHSRVLPELGISSALGDALGSFAIIMVAYVGQRIASLAMFNDTELGTLRMWEEMRKTNETMQSELGELDRQASTDKLTGAWNRRRLEEAVRGEMDRLARYSHALCMLVVDIDHFKQINDTHGHTAGDQVLIELSQMLRGALRITDSLTRWGGEEFVVLCPNTALSTASLLADRLRRKLAAHEFPGVGRVTVSIGVAECHNGEAWDIWFQRADAALYQAKAGGRNQVQVAPNAADHISAGESRLANFVQLVWHPAYESGNDTIDGEHRRLFEGANTLLSAILAERPRDEIGQRIDALIRETAAHFGHEEGILAAAAYPQLLEHAAAHRHLVSRANELLAHFQADTLEIGELFQFVAHEVVAKHLLAADREFFPFLADAPG
jgi:diguanylate cyclase (GGDEF)-like protein/hemerythrin-like metal-binding protein